METKWILIVVGIALVIMAAYSYAESTGSISPTPLPMDEDKEEAIREVFPSARSVEEYDATLELAGKEITTTAIVADGRRFYRIDADSLSTARDVRPVPEPTDDVI